MGGGFLSLNCSFGKDEDAPAQKEKRGRIRLCENILSFECCIGMCSAEL